MSKEKVVNPFLKVDKKLFSLGLNPTELLILAQIIEFETNKMVCYMTNEQFAAMLNVSEKTVSRALNDTLKANGYIDIINPKSKNRSFKLNMSAVEAKLRQNVQEEKQGQNVQDNLDKLSNQHGQNDPIKDKEKDKIKNNKEEINQPSVDVITSTNTPESPEVKEDGTANHPFKVNKEWLIERYNELYECGNGMFRYRNEFYKMT